ncbi:hypothetical protein [Chamaesiphon minutus]|nr:hypothetical protein [Chamaesiphon minutus]
MRCSSDPDRTPNITECAKFQVSDWRSPPNAANLQFNYDICHNCQAAR